MAARRKTLPFHIVDVFAVEPLTGNPLAVVDGGADLSLDLFRRIAREFNQSETTFVLPPTRPQADWRLRSFTRDVAPKFSAPAATIRSVPGGGLPKLESFALSGSATEFHQEIGDRVLPVTVSRTGARLAKIVMDQEAPIAGRQLEDLAKLAAALGLATPDRLRIVCRARWFPPVPPI